MSDIFVSYTFRETNLGSEITGALERAGYVVWDYRRDGQPAKHPGDDIRQTSAVVMIISAADLNSAQQDTVLRHARKAGKPTICVLKETSYSTLVAIRRDWAELLPDKSKVLDSEFPIESLERRLLNRLGQILIRSTPTGDATNISRTATKAKSDPPTVSSQSDETRQVANTTIVNHRVRSVMADERAPNPSPTGTVRDRVFVSYSHQDRRWLEQLQTMLKPYVRGNTVQLWVDTMIDTGAPWLVEIERALASTKVAVLLVTPNFLASEFIAHTEMPRILEAAEKDGATIFWVAVSASAYKETEIRHFQAANNPAVPLDSMGTARRNQEWVRICDRIKEALNR